MINELQLQLTDVHPQGLVEIEQNLLKTEFESDDDVFTQNQSLRRTRPTTQELDDLESELLAMAVGLGDSGEKLISESHGPPIKRHATAVNTLAVSCDGTMHEGGIGDLANGSVQEPQAPTEIVFEQLFPTGGENAPDKTPSLSSDRPSQRHHTHHYEVLQLHPFVSEDHGACSEGVAEASPHLQLSGTSPLALSHREADGDAVNGHLISSEREAVDFAIQNANQVPAHKFNAWM